MMIQQSAQRLDHIDRTASDWRSAPIFSAQILRIRAESTSSTTKSFLFGLLRSEDARELQYKPGQWLDVFIPNVETASRATALPFKELTENRSGASHLSQRH